MRPNAAARSADRVADRENAMSKATRAAGEGVAGPRVIFVSVTTLHMKGDIHG
jgi:hypothetical protein